MTQQTRKDPRAKVLSMTVRYKSATLDEFIEHHSHDVSRGGMFIKTPQPFPPGTLLKFEVRIAEDRKVMQGVGRVVWKRDLAAADGERPAGMGVKFIKLDDDSRRLIDQLLSMRRDETSAYDAEGSQPGLDTEAPVGLGTDPISIPSPKPTSPEPSFFPKSDAAELPPPEDRTVMKQAAELLEEALREVGTSTSPAKSRAPAEDEKEDTKPGRHSKPSDSVLRLPEPKMPPAAPPHAAAAAIPSKNAPKPTSLSPGKPAPPVRSHAPDLASVAQELTEKAREIAASKAPPATSAKPAPKPPTAPSKPSRPAAGSAPVVAVAPQPGAPPPVKTGAKGSGRGLIWALAVAACAAVTWWIWSKPHSGESTPSDAPAAQEQRAAVPNPPAQDNPAPAATATDSAPTPAAAPSAPAAAEASAEPSAAPVPSAAEPEPAAAAQAAAPAPAQPKDVPAATPPVRTAATRTVKPKAAAAEPAAPAENAASEPPPTTNEAPAAPEKAAEPKPAEPKPAEPKPAEPKPAAPSEEPVAKPPPAEAPAAPAAPKASTKKAKASADPSDNPY